jgi:hypothetical protein
MRIAPFFFALSLLGVSILPQGWRIQSLPLATAPSDFADRQSASQTLNDGVAMMSQADIVVVPVDVALANRAERASLRDRVLQAEVDVAKLDLSDPAVRREFAQQRLLMKGLLDYAGRQGRDEGKSRMAIQVQKHLNAIEGRVMCQACHGGSPRTNGIAE